MRAGIGDSDRERRSGRERAICLEVRRASRERHEVARTILITGGGRGVGRACALAFAREGDRVAVCARTEAEVQSVARECLAAGAPAAISQILDVTNPASVDRAVGAVESALGPVEVLLHAAGGARTASVEKTTEALWAEMLSVNLTSAFYISRAVLPSMLKTKRGRILYIGSTASRTGFRYCSAYAAAKHGLLGFARSLAEEVAGQGITANVIGPGFLDAESTRAAAQEVAARTGKSVESVLESYKSFSPQKRLISLDEVAAAAVYLASSGAAGINGQCLLIDGGEIVS